MKNKEIRLDSEDNSHMEKIKRALNKISEYNITFSKHFQEKAKKVRGIDEDMVIGFLNSPDKILNILLQSGNRYKIETFSKKVSSKT